jgi:hypothetical protein
VSAPVSWRRRLVILVLVLLDIFFLDAFVFLEMRRG